MPQAEVPSIVYHAYSKDLKFQKYALEAGTNEAFLRNYHAILPMSDRCSVYYFLCPNCRRTAAVPESFRYGLSCPYCNSEMKAIVTED